MKLYLTSITANVINKINFENKKKVVFILTAANPYSDKSFIEPDKKALKNKGLELTIYDIENKTQETLTKDLSKFEIIFVSGGNSFYLLEQIKKTGFDKVLKKFQKTDIIYIGSSAGSVIVCPDIKYIEPLDDPKEAKNLQNYKGINLIDFYVLPHFNTGIFGEISKTIYQEKANTLKLVPITDNQLIEINTTTNNYKII